VVMMENEDSLSGQYLEFPYMCILMINA